MNFETFEKQANDFKNRIIKAFKLIEDEGSLIQHKKLVIDWLRKKQKQLEIEKKNQPSSNIIKAILNKSSIEEKKKKRQKQKALYQKLTNFFQTKSLEDIKNLQEFIEEDFFKQIKESLSIVLKNNLTDFYGFIRAPLIGKMYMAKKQDFRACVENSPNHNLKFIVTEAKVAHKYQRNLVQQVFGRVIRRKGAMSLMIKIEIDVLPDEKDIDVYCYIEDLTFKGGQFKHLSEVELVEKEENKYTFELKSHTNQTLQLNRESLLEIFLSQMIVIPVQTLVSDFIVEVTSNSANLIKCHQGSRQEIGESILLKDHPSIRNPLFYFKNYIAKNEIQISQILMFNTKKIYGNFYCSLNIISKLIIDDFNFSLEDKRINSMCFNLQTFINLWHIIHDLVMLSDWVEEVIHPIKESVTIFQILDKFCPILTQMLSLEGKTFKQYRKHLLHLEIDTFMANNVPKNVIERYKDLYVSLHNYDDPNTYGNKFEVYNKIFAPVMDEFDLLSCDVYEAIYFLNFVAENRRTHGEQDLKIQKSWTNYKVWKNIYKLKETQDLPYINLYLDILGLYIGVDTVGISQRPFIYVKNQSQTPQFLKDLDNFIIWMKVNHQKNYHNYLSILFQKAYRFKKYKICNVLLKYGILMNEFEDIFEFDQVLTEAEENEKNELSQNLKKQSPQMYRKLKWEQLMRVTLREESPDSVPMNSIQYGQIFIKNNVYEAMKIGQIENNISRKDYMYDPDRQMIRESFSEGNDAYVEFTEYPLVRYFYRLFLQKLNKAHLMPNFTGILTNNGVMLHLIEAIHAGLNFQKGYNSFSETDLKNLCDKDELSESIILSIILMPSRIELKNIIAVPGNTSSNSIFMIDLKEFYRSNPIEKVEGNYFLKSVNCLFTFDQMHKSISTELMKKYSNTDIITFVEGLFIELSKLIKTVNQMKRDIKEKNPHQLLGLIFEKNFIINLTERLFKVQNIFKDCFQKKKSISHMDVLALINPQLSYFYQEIIKSSSSLLEREKNLFDQNWRKSFINRCSLIEFFAPSSMVSEPLNLFPNHYRKLCFDGPTQNLNTLYNQSQKFVVYQNNIDNLNPFYHETLEYYIKNLDFSKLNAEQRKTAVNKLQEKSREYLTKKGCLPLSIIKLQDVDVPKASELNFSFERIKEVIIESLKTTDVELAYILKTLISAVFIRIKNLIGVTSLGESPSFLYSLELRNLRILSINECPTLNLIDLKCDALESVTLRDNPVLQIVYINSFSLKNLDFTGSSKLKLENVGLYILKGLNVLLGEIACDGYIKKLWDNSYSTYVFNILKFLLNRLKQSQIKAVIITTLTKLSLLEQEIASTLLGVPSIGYVANMLLKYNLDLEKKVYFKLMDLFFNNQMIESFIATDMSLSNIEQIATYLQQNLKKYKNSFKQTKINHTIKNNFQSFKKIFTSLNLKKYYKLSLEGLELDTDEEPMQMIDILINNRQDIEKVDLFFERCKISTNLFDNIFRSKNIIRIQVAESVINNGIAKAEVLDNLKEAHLSNSVIQSFELLNSLNNLTILQIDACELPADVNNLYNSIGKKKNIKRFKFTNQKQVNKDIKLSLLLNNLKQIPSLSILNLSNNSFNEEELQLINEFTKESHLEELILRNFYQKGLEYKLFSEFLKNSSLRQLIIQFPLHEEHNLKHFIESLSQQKTIMKLYLHTETQIASQIFAPLNKNKTLHIIDSNQSIPTWLKKHLRSNKIERSKVSFGNKNTGIEYDMFMPIETKEYEFHKLGLSLDGGGMRGLLIATELEYLAKEVGYPLHKIFDVIGGTSIGGIESLAISCSLDNIHPILSPPELKQIFTVHGKDIFKKSNIRSIAHIYDTKYSPTYIQNLLNYYFKDCKLSDTLKETNCIVTAVNRINNKDAIFKSTDAILNRDKDFFAKDIGRATSAAPTYFPSAEIKNVIASQKLSLVDGGMGMNNPSKLVIDEVKKMAFNSRNEKNYFLLSLGTGRLPSETIPEYAGMKDLSPIIDSFTESACYFTQRDLTQNYKGHFMRVSPLINLSKKEAELDKTDPHILKAYEDTGLSAAKDFFSNTIIFGKYRTMSLVEWLRQNTQRKYDI